jgi:hypothetical protein
VCCDGVAESASGRAAGRCCCSSLSMLPPTGHHWGIFYASRFLA